MRVKPLELAAFLALVVAANPLAAQLTPPSTGGIARLDFLLHKLSENRRVLVIGAHPDDEDTSFLTAVVRGYGADAAYLSLCRGEGGQNLIGDELGVQLGLVRTGELMAARSVDGARQFFARAYDFGFSKTLEETSRFWQPDSVLKDVVRVIRRFRPHVVLSIFSGTIRDGHGHHQLAGVVARDAFDVAADPTRFPELHAEEGLDPWTPLKLYQSTWFDPASTTLELSTGTIEARSGRTYQQIAMESRSRHSSQDMGRPQPIGPANSRLRLLVDRTEALGEDAAVDSLFLGISNEAGWVGEFADSLRHELSPSRLSDASQSLARALIRAGSDSIPLVARELLLEATTISAGLVMDSRAESAEIVPGQAVEVVVEAYNGGPFDIQLKDVVIDAPPRWSIEGIDSEASPLAPGELAIRRFVVTAPVDASPTQPYYLDRPLVGAFYDWSSVPSDLRSSPFDPPLLVAVVNAELLGSPISSRRETTYRYTDQAVGEMRLPVTVVPTIDVKLDPPLLVWASETSGEREFAVTLTHNGDSAVSGSVALVADGLDLPDPISFSFDNRGESRFFNFSVTKPSDISEGTIRLRAVARVADGRSYDSGIERVAYPHIRPFSKVVEASSELRIAPILLPAARRIGYVRGAADRVPEFLPQVGLPLELIEGEALQHLDLSEFDVVVVGSRAYETDAALVRFNQRLMDYVARGGHLVVLYQQYQFAAGDFAPFEIGIARPHDRITDETAAVTLLQPDHPLFTRLNSIRDSDWDGWPQERGLYFAGTWDEAYTPLLEMADPGGEPLQGGLLVAEYGEGTYVYTGLSFFRAIPAGVPGAYRLFMNILEYGVQGGR